jgi:hypothetical protein
MLPPIARATTISAGISILDPECLSVYAQPSSFGLATWSFSSGNRFRPHRAQLAPCRKNPKPGNPSFSAHSINTSPTLTSWSPDFAGVIALGFKLRQWRLCADRGQVNVPVEPPERRPVKEHVDRAIAFEPGLADFKPASMSSAFAFQSKSCVRRGFRVGHAMWLARLRAWGKVICRLRVIEIVIHLARGLHVVMPRIHPI